MDAGQIVIKIVLLAAFAVLGFLLVFPGKGTRHQALRRLSLIVAIVGGVVAVIFPNLLTRVANLVGVGRGADLLLYALCVVFVGQLIRSRSHDNALQRQITDLARYVAIARAPQAGAAGVQALQGGSPAGDEPVPPQPGQKPGDEPRPFDR